MIRVGRCGCRRDGSRKDPYYPGFRTIVVLTRGTNRWGMLGPYELKDEHGRIMENVWQFSKVYPEVERTYQKKSQHETKVIWDHPGERHVKCKDKPPTADNLLEEYWLWREKGFAAPYAVRYPPGFGHMHKCVGALIEGHPNPVGYIEARKLLYVPLYTRLAMKSPLFYELARMIASGQNLLIAEVDGPHQESLQYYVDKYGVDRDFIESNTMLATPENLRIMLNDPVWPFGHGYCLAAALAGIDLIETDTQSDLLNLELDAILSD